jgi:hypothetical protein
MPEKLNCFVIIGYGKKTSYANGKLRLLDLDQTYSLLIKPVFDTLNISCYRAIDKNLTGSIDEVMLEEIKNADIALVDISTLNANVMWELGVRHALKDYYTIMICEKEQMSSIPFDINSFVVLQYTHSEEGIPYNEVERFRALLTGVVKGVLAQNPSRADSPVSTFLRHGTTKETAAPEKMVIAADPSLNTDSLATLLEKAEEAKNKNDFAGALDLLATAKKYAAQNMTLKDNLTFIICRQALCTYKLEKPTKLEAFVNAKVIMDELKPEQSQDIEVLGLSGAIHKRLSEFTGSIDYLNSAIFFYERGFQLKQDYYNGINATFMLYKKAGILKQQQQDWEDVKLKADYIRNSVLEITLQIETKNNFAASSDATWVLLTIAEAWHYKKNEVKMAEYEKKAKDIADKTNDTFAMGTYQDQKKNIDKYLNL